MRIPKIIIQTFKSRELPPLMKMAQRSWISKNPKWTYRFFTDEAVIKFVDEFDADQFEFSSIDLKAAFTKIRPGAGKADLFRYLYLAAHGGAYFDIDTVCKNLWMNIYYQMICMYPDLACEEIYINGELSYAHNTH